ncbi:uncharacterized protein BHQ10_005155 [Talaromyces amestolkiae]|uniref:Isochorismatase-like domain-containing protein n=1 Tax=Talaromyces amestolkiae TaxID=1196081 RepID=A0A364L006_TALAM|nr:uncharacterized protein BHQ10_005155 [Talaromyces amestolkiae]RAO69143.1 hypothetical protein BHQ10_005155 [Talaromyces amestolkiae]
MDGTRTTLLLLDFHKFIVSSQPSSGQRALTKAVHLRTWARAQGMLIVHCMIDLRAVTAPERKMATRANGIKTKMSIADPGSRGEPDEIAATSDEYIFWRPPSHVSALGSYGLQEFLHQHGVKSLLLAGFSTSGCVINTAKQAADSGFITTVISDACGDKSEEAHGVIMERLLIGQCHVVEEETFVNAWDGDFAKSTEKIVITSS